jgi:hypothetical protein
MPTNIVKSWLIKKGYMIPKGSSSSPITHVFLDGGKACVPLDALDELFDVFVNALARGESVALVERLSASPTYYNDSKFRMFMDIDISKALDIASLREIVTNIATALPSSLMECTMTITVSKCSSEILGNGTGAVAATSTKPEIDRCGLHLVWCESTLVTSKQAQDYVAVVAANVPDYKAYLDTSVFKNNGLRMNFTHKGKGDSRIYTPWIKIGFKSHDDKVSPEISEILSHGTTRADMVSSLKATSIIYRSSPDQQQQQQQPAQLLTSDARDAASVKPEWQAAWAQLTQDTPYRGSRLVSVQKQTLQTMTFRIDSRYCMNVKREHKSENVTICVKPNVVEQRCFCKCPDTGCAKFKGAVAAAGNMLSRSIYGKRARSSGKMPDLLIASKSRHRPMDDLMEVLKKQRFNMIDTQHPQ